MIWILSIVALVLLGCCFYFKQSYLALFEEVRRLALHGKVSEKAGGKEWSVYLQDLKEQKNQNKRLAIQEKDELKGMMQFLQTPVWMQDNDGMIIRGNQAFQEILKKKFEPDFYWNLIDFPELFRFVDGFDGKKNNTSNLHLGDSYYIASGSLLPSGGKVFILQDITELSELQTLKKDLLINISHELKTPLTTISGFLELLPAENDKVLTILKRNAERLRLLVDDILQLSTIESLSSFELEKIDLVQVVEESKLLFSEKKVTIETSFFTDKVEISADPFRLQQVVVNLLSNAVKYTSEGKITVKIEKIENGCELKIVDTGIGISKENLPKIFQRFFVGDSSRSKSLDNTGLGLAIVKNIVEKHGWKIAVESELGVGTEVKISIVDKNS